MALAIIGTFTVIAGTVAYLLVKISREHDEESEHVDESSFNK